MNIKLPKKAHKRLIKQLKRRLRTFKALEYHNQSGWQEYHLEIVGTPFQLRFYRSSDAEDWKRKSIDLKTKEQEQLAEVSKTWKEEDILSSARFYLLGKAFDLIYEKVSPNSDEAFHEAMLKETPEHFLPEVKLVLSFAENALK